MGKLNYIRGPKPATTGDLEALKNKVDNLSNITVKNNLTNQIIPQQKINSSPTNEQNIIRLAEQQYVRIVNHTSQLNANNVGEWTPNGLNIENNKVHQFIIKLGVNNVDYIFEWSGYITNANYKNMGPTFTFAANNTDFNETCKVKFWVDNNKVKLLCSINLANVVVYLKKGFTR